MGPCSWGGVLSGKNRLSPENFVSVIGEVSGLLGFEGADVQRQLNAPLLQRLLDAGLGTQQVAGISEGYPTTVEQFIDVMEEQQAVVAIETLGAITFTPGFDVAGNQQILVAHTGYPAGVLYLLKPTAEEALATSGAVDGPLTPITSFSYNIYTAPITWKTLCLPHVFKFFFSPKVICHIKHCIECSIILVSFIPGNICIYLLNCCF